MVDAMEGQAKLRVKVGISEFEAEGPAEMVKQQYDDFLAAVAKVSAAISPATPLPSTPAQAVINAGTGTITGSATLNAVSADRDQFRRVFAENDAVISLRAFPNTETRDADAVLLLIYGYQELRQNDYPVTGVRLMQAAKQSGLQIKRIDRTIEAHDRLVLKAGMKRGRKYSLNNQGVTRAQELISEMLG